MSRVLAALRCETCGGPIERIDLQPERGIAVCGPCGAVPGLRRLMSALPSGRAELGSHHPTLP